MCALHEDVNKVNDEDACLNHFLLQYYKEKQASR